MVDVADLNFADCTTPELLRCLFSNKQCVCAGSAHSRMMEKRLSYRCIDRLATTIRCWMLTVCQPRWIQERFWIFKGSLRALTLSTGRRSLSRNNTKPTITRTISHNKKDPFPFLFLSSPNNSGNKSFNTKTKQEIDLLSLLLNSKCKQNPSIMSESKPLIPTDSEADHFRRLKAGQK